LLRRTALFDVLSVKIGLTDSPVGELKYQKKCCKFRTKGVYISPICGAKASGRIKPKFCLMVNVYNIITPFKSDDDRFRGFGLAEGRNLPFLIYFESRFYNTRYRVKCNFVILHFIALIRQ